MTDDFFDFDFEMASPGMDGPVPRFQGRVTLAALAKLGGPVQPNADIAAMFELCRGDVVASAIHKIHSLAPEAEDPVVVDVVDLLPA
ncbi:MAG: hypothetical protein ACRYG4_01170 [Janthinobacterium lividum]